jgi:ubiquinone/menaquinone biosynthesis C-methylase UbiE
MTTRAALTPEERAARVRRAYDKVAPRYDRAIAVPERLFFAGGRAWVAGRAKGCTLEIGIGTGRNLTFYPAGLEIVGIDTSSEMLALARSRAKAVDRAITLEQADAEQLPFPDASFDTVVSTLSFCTIPDDRRAMREAVRVLRPGGRLVLLEHVRSPMLLVRLAQRLLEPMFTWLACDHLTREPLDLVKENGLVIDELERLRWGIVERLVARRP